MFYSIFNRKVVDLGLGVLNESISVNLDAHGLES